MIDNCEYVRSLMKAYFMHSATNKQIHTVVNHLKKCHSCFKYYLEYAESVGLEFDLTREIIKAHYKYPLSESESEPDCDDDSYDDNATTNTDLMEYVKNVWYNAAAEEDYFKLMNSKAIRDCVKEANELANNEDTSEAQREFKLFLIKKICQKLDHLEACYNMKE